MLIFQVSQITALPQVQAELLLRFQQLQSRLSTLKIENEEVRHTHTHTHPFLSNEHLSSCGSPTVDKEWDDRRTHLLHFSFPSLFVVRHCIAAHSFTTTGTFIHIVSIFSVSVGVRGCLSQVVGRPAVSCSSQHVKDRAEVLMNAVLLQWVSTVETGTV